MSHRILTYGRLREVMDYDPEKGMFAHKVSFGSRAWAGKSTLRTQRT